MRGHELHLCLPELCEGAGVECNEQNAQVLMDAAREVFRPLEAEGPVEFVEEL